MDAIKTLFKQISEYWAGKDKSFRRTVIVCASVLLVAAVVAGLLLSHKSYDVLFSDLDDADAGDVMAVLEEMSADAKVEGDTILVPAQDVDKLRMELAREGYPKNAFSLDILSQGQGLMSTESDKQDYRKYQMQYNLQNMIRQFSGVADAQVMLTIPQESSLVIQSNRQDATAAILLKLKGGAGIDEENIRAIASFVQKSVPGLTMENISIVDSNMNVLDFTSGGELDETSDHIAMQQSVQDRLQKQVMALLMPIFGVGRVQAQVAVTLDFDKQVTQTERFEPVAGADEGIIRSIDRLREEIVNGGAAQGEAGTGANTGTAQYPVVNTENGTYEKNSEKINYEINSIKDHIEKAQGTVRNLSVSVAIDSNDAEGDYTEIVTELVAGTVGVEDDAVTVRYIPMSGTQGLNEAMAQQQQAAADQARALRIRDYVMIGVIALVALIALLLLSRALRSRRAEEPAGGEFLQDMTEEEQAEALGVLRDSGTREQLSKFVDTNPELAANLLRSWLSEEE